MTGCENFFKKHSLNIHEILYVYRSNRKTLFCCNSGEEITSSLPVHKIMDFLPEEQFALITKGTIVRLDQIIHISDEGVYTMTNGKTFQGRQRFLSMHKQLRQELFPQHQEKLAFTSNFPMTFLEKCSILEDMPLAYCIIELVFDNGGQGINFLIRYCNKHMEVLTGISAENMMGRPFYEVFKNGEKNWLIAYANIALNGSKCTLHTHHTENEENNTPLTLYCYQPEPGFCACVFVSDENV